MRNRFFWSILAVILLVTIGTTIFHGEFLRHEKMQLIDQQVRETATALLDSELGDLRIVEFDKVERILSEELGENRIGKFFVIRSNAGQPLFESSGALLLPVSELPLSPRWVTIQQKGKYIRLLNLSLPQISDRTLQVGVIIGEELLSPGYFSFTNVFFTGTLILVSSLVAWILTVVLLRPISKLAGFVSSTALDPQQRLELPPLPRALQEMAQRLPLSDEFANLLRSFEKLILRINSDYRLSRVLTYQMAHELKTPMALIEAKVAQAQRNGKLDEALAHEILVEVFKTSETITSFLTWAELENATEQRRLYVVPISRVVKDLKVRLDQSFPNRLQLHLQTEVMVMTDLQHLEQALGNLIVNALLYSPADRPVRIETSESQIQIIDQGSGLSPRVLERLGEPFNKGPQENPQRKGTGLGLALVKSICRIYHWRLDIEPSAQGTVVTLHFPDASS